MVAADGGLLAVVVCRDAPEHRHAARLWGIVDLINRCLHPMGTPVGLIGTSCISSSSQEPRPMPDAQLTAKTGSALPAWLTQGGEAQQADLV